MTTLTFRRSTVLAAAAAALLVWGIQPAYAQRRQQQAVPAAAPTMTDSTVLPPQDIGTILPGQIRRGTLEPGDWTMSDGTFCDIWYIQAAAGQRVVITLRSRSFDSYLQLLDQGGTKVADDDDSGGGGGAARITYTFRTGERFQIVVNNYSDAVAAGLYTVEVR